MGLGFCRGRGAVGWAITGLAGVLIAAWLSTGSPYSAWRFLGVPFLSPAFADLRSITHALDCVANGVDPLTTNACDPFGRPFNYPSIWLRLGVLGISSASTDVIGFLFMALFWASLLLIYDTRTTASGLVAFAAAISPPVLLGLERGNIDVFIFATSVITVYFLAKRTGIGATLVQCATIACLAVLKIYPIAIATILARRRWGFTGIALTGALAAIGLLGLDGPEGLKTIARNTPNGTALSYGALPIFLSANDHGLLPEVFTSDTLHLISAGTALALAGIAILVALRQPGILRGILPGLDLASPNGAIALACVSIFCFSFLLGSNFDYRLIFLLGILPVLLAAHESEGRADTMIAPATIVLFLWASRFSTHFFVPFEIFDWSMFIISMMWAAQTVFARPSALPG